MATEKSKGPKSIAVFQGATVQQVAADLGEYGSTESFIVILKDGKNYYLQVKSVDGDGGDPLNDSKVCPGSPGCA